MNKIDMIVAALLLPALAFGQVGGGSGGIGGGGGGGATWSVNIAGQPAVVPQEEAEAGVATTERMWTAERVANAIAALAPAGAGESAGSSGDIQYSDGTGGFQAGDGLHTNDGLSLVISQVTVPATQAFVDGSPGSLVLAKIDHATGGSISSAGSAGALVLGYVTGTYPGSIGAYMAPGSITFGQNGGGASGDIIQSTGAGAVAGGRATGYDDTFTAAIQATGAGSVAVGDAASNGVYGASIIAGGSGSVALGYTGAGDITAQQNGAVAFGLVFEGDIEANGEGSVAGGNAQSGGSISSTGEGALAFGKAASVHSIVAAGAGAAALGDSTNGDIAANAANAMQLGPGTNDQELSIQVGGGIRIGNALPVTPRPGDLYVTDGEVRAYGSREHTIGEFVHHCVLTGPAVNATVAANVNGFYAPFDLIIAKYRITARSAPTGADLIVDLLVDASSAVVSGSEQIDAASTTSFDSVSGHATLSATVTAGMYVSFDITQIGSTLPGTGIEVWVYGVRTGD